MSQTNIQPNLFLTKKRLAAILICAACLWFLFTGFLTVVRYRANYASTYDFGIFSQMYYYMDQTLAPMTTCERDGLLSHFAVHLSPIFYLLLPVYHLIPRQETLLVLQALLVASGMIPMYLLAKAFRLSNWEILGFTLMYCLYPAFMGGCFYDFHENKFLAALILWCMYFMETKRFLAMFASLFLLLTVKEDAPVYAACIGLYLFLWKKEYVRGASAFILSCAYFIGAVWYINRFGDGAMVNRFDNFISDPDLGLISMFKTLLVNPAYLLSQIAVKDKIWFILQMTLPLFFLPFMTGHWQKWVLLIPFVLINLMSNYKYQHSIYFQYVYGSGALLLYLSLSNYCALKKRRKGSSFFPLLLCAAGLFWGTAFTSTVIIEKSDYLPRYLAHREDAARARDLLSQIPQDACVKASTFFLPQLSMRDEIYLLESHHPAPYLVVDLRKGYEKDLEQKLASYEEQGYKALGVVEDYVTVLTKLP